MDGIQKEGLYYTVTLRFENGSLMQLGRLGHFEPVLREKCSEKCLGETNS